MSSNIESEILFIKRVIEESRKSALNNGKYYILWGVLISIASLATYLIEKLDFDFNPNYLWGVCILAGWFFSGYWGYKEGKNPKTTGLASKVIPALWSSLGITMMVIVLAGIISGSIKYVSISPLIAAVIGVGYFTSGTIYSDTMLKVLAFCWWGASVVMFNLSGIEVLLANGIFIIVFQVIPGFILLSKWKKDFTVSNA
ncbi:MAG: hypothetical protein JSS63_06500 [Bacteroidetes bacterium]|nr:hypothetical protein [Bacteroidota bacterium]